MQLFFSFLLLVIGLSMAPVDHDIHVSVTDIEIEADGKIEVVVKVFLDDLMHSLGLELGAELPEDYTSSDDMINEFLNNSLEILINGKAIDLELEDTTPSSPAVWITLIGKTSEMIESVEVENKILIEQFDDQSNMVNIDLGKTRYSELLDADQTRYTVTVGE